ncbi:DUF2243 domain-containing protein (plasmid) [Rhodococcus sp. ZPP]|uniref:DUF2243 domain-containing protein n=1 Tax=Rhodococcus sp. ZPP TaxID=2749906 RepID=UPI001AD88ECC|nr:DUF2243 domain-containing protein [Rhodococcus sp. ZPP]QTJ71289.1 DUF2243 domain-containing protein [Rhodococcus sp. ZPP]
MALRRTRTSEQERTARGSWHLDGAQGSFWSGILLAAAVFTIIDETILHLLLHWHHFYDRASPGFALTSDGIFQAVGVISLVASAYLVADLRRRAVWRPIWLATGLAFGLGIIGLIDEVVVHKILNWHQIHYGAEVWKYDIGAGLCIVTALLAGAALLRIARRGGEDLRIGKSQVLSESERPDDTDRNADG